MLKSRASIKVFKLELAYALMAPFVDDIFQLGVSKFHLSVKANVTSPIRGCFRDREKREEGEF